MTRDTLSSNQKTYLSLLSWEVQQNGLTLERFSWGEMVIDIIAEILNKNDLPQCLVAFLLSSHLSARSEAFKSSFRFLAHPDGHQYGVFIQIPINLGKKTLRLCCIKNTVT